VRAEPRRTYSLEGAQAEISSGSGLDKYSQVPHNNVSASDRLYIQQWSCKVLMALKHSYYLEMRQPL
jgi:hypothetical protein